MGLWAPLQLPRPTIAIAFVLGVRCPCPPGHSCPVPSSSHISLRIAHYPGSFLPFMREFLQGRALGHQLGEATSQHHKGQDGQQVISTTAGQRQGGECGQGHLLWLSKAILARLATILVPPTPNSPGDLLAMGPNNSLSGRIHYSSFYLAVDL